MNTFAKWEEVPMFDSETAEAEFWMENRPDLRLMESAIAASSESSESVTINLRFDPRMLARIKRLARSRYLNYQSMIKQWLSERMEQELREATPKLMKNDLPNRRTAAFTLVELLTVITIMALLAGLLVGALQIAKAKGARANAEAQRDALITAITRYQKDKGYYPPDNAVGGSNYDSIETSLFYEITGCVSGTYFTNKITGEVLNTSANSLTAMFNVGGILNSTPAGGNPNGDASTTRDYYDNLKANQHSLITNGGGFTFSVFGIPTLQGPVMLNGGNFNGGQSVNPFHYVSTSPTNNPNSFDLWIDVLWSGHTNRVCNWSADPIVL